MFNAALHSVERQREREQRERERDLRERQRDTGRRYMGRVTERDRERQEE